MHSISYKNKYHKNSLPVVSALILTVCVLISFAVLANNLGIFARDEIKAEIDLLSESSASVKLADSGSNSYGATVNNVPNFSISDDTQTWESNTQLNIFKVSYQNGEIVINAVAPNGDKIIAPGMSSDCSFVLNNTGNTALDYTVSIEAYISDSVTSIPVQAKLKDYTGKYLLGSETEWQPVLDLNGISDSASLSAGYHSTYTLGWQWPFEGDDKLDTELGNMAEDVDITLTVVIKTVASANAAVDSGQGQPPNTDNGFNILIWSVLAVTSLLALILLILIKRREQKEDSADAAY